MAEASVPSVFVDANVWFQSLPRYLCINLHLQGLCFAWYSDLVMKECQRNLVKRGLKPQEVASIISGIEQELPYSQVLLAHQQTRIERVFLPDEDDRHVLYATVATRSAFLVTDNLKDFKPEYLKHKRNRFLRLPENFRAIRLDEFLCEMLYQDLDAFIEALVQTLIPMELGTPREHLESLRSASNCPNTFRWLEPFIHEIEETVERKR